MPKGGQRAEGGEEARVMMLAYTDIRTAWPPLDCVPVHNISLTCPARLSVDSAYMRWTHKQCLAVTTRFTPIGWQ